MLSEEGAEHGACTQHSGLCWQADLHNTTLSVPVDASSSCECQAPRGCADVLRSDSEVVTLGFGHAGVLLGEVICILIPPTGTNSCKRGLVGPIGPRPLYCSAHRSTDVKEPVAFVAGALPCQQQITYCSDFHDLWR